MRKTVLYAACVGAICIITFFVLYMSGFDTNRNVKFLAEYGWSVFDETVEIEEIFIPESFDSVYENYNALQKQAGLNLEKYKGEKAVRYTYIVKNYPKKREDEVRANVVCVNGRPVAGDIMTVGLDGFMHSLKFPMN